jgi:hypothetical protein
MVTSNPLVVKFGWAISSPHEWSCDGRRLSNRSTSPVMFPSNLRINYRFGSDIDGSLGLLFLQGRHGAVEHC